MHSSSATASEPHARAQDLLLVRQALRGDPAAVEAVLARLSCAVRFVFRLNRRLGYRLPIEALEDVVQHVYAALWPRLGDYAGSSALETWVFGFCRNCLRAEARRRATGLRLLPSGGDDSALTEHAVDSEAPDSELTRGERLDALREELDRLAPDERHVVELRHFENQSFEQIARQLNLPASTVKDRCYRALVKMKGRLRRRDVSA